MFNFAIDEGLCNTKNPVRKGAIDQRSEEASKRLEYLTVEEVGEYLSACSPEYYAVALTAIETGMRKGEILTLTWAQVDFNHKIITLNKTKSGRRRMVYMSDTLTAMLRGLKCISQGNDVFVSRYHRKYKSIKGAHESALQRSGIAEKRAREGKPHLKFHDLRHTAATLQAQITGDIYMVSDFLGHSTIEMTKRYAHLTEDRKRSAAQGLSDLIHDGKRHKNDTIVEFARKRVAGEFQKSAVE